MKKAIIFLFAFTLNCTLFGQGVNGELGFNNSFQQNLKGNIVATEGYSYFFLKEYQGGISSTSYLVKMDTLGNVKWKKAFPNQPEIFSLSIIASESGGVYVSCFSMSGCDLMTDPSQFIQKIESDGTIAWTREFNISSETSFAAIKEQDNVLYVNKYIYSYPGPNPPTFQSLIYTMDINNGDVLDSLENLSIFDLSYIEKSSVFDFLVVPYHKENKLFAIDSNGENADSLVYSQMITGIVTVNDTIFVLTVDSIFSYHSDLTLINSGILTNYPNTFELKRIDDNLRFLSILQEEAPEITVVTIDHNFNVLDADTIIFPLGMNYGHPYYVDFSENHFSMVDTYLLTHFSSVRHTDYSLNSPINNEINRTDAEIIELDIYQSSITPAVGFDGIYATQLSGKVILKNVGNKQMTECRINHFIMDSWICGGVAFSKLFTGLNLAPGDTTWLDLELFHNDTGPLPSVNDSLIKDICVYSSNPNGIVDLNRDNDEFCKAIYFGTVGLSEFTQQENQKKIVKIVDLLGQEIEEEPNTLMIYIYDDGTTKKVINSK